jgi:hypothetical protein
MLTLRGVFGFKGESVTTLKVARDRNVFIFKDFCTVFTDLKQLPESRGEHRHGGGHTEPYQGVLETLLDQDKADQLLFHAPTQEKVRWRPAQQIGGVSKPPIVRGCEVILFFYEKLVDQSCQLFVRP